jgi:pSer/pThr/pTyr-binding forkhead associated (FHA) protein
MFKLFNKDTDSRPQDVKGLRDALFHFIKEELQRVEGGEGRHIKGICLFIACSDEEKYLYESAVCLEDPERFKAEVQKIADDFAIDLPDNWTMETSFVDTLPPECIKSSELAAGLFIKTRQHSIKKSNIAYVRVLGGEAEKEVYEITPESGKITIGREKKAQTDDGFFRLNAIAFPGDSSNECNKYISRQHAHIEWNSDAEGFMLYADEGGVPPRNKIKIKAATDDNTIKLNSTHIGHLLREGDQIVLGESAVLEFQFTADA